MLYSSARDLGPKGRDSQFGYGLVDPLHALDALEAKVAMGKATTPVAATTPMPKPLHVSATTEKMTVSELPPAPAQAEQAPASPEPPAAKPAAQAHIPAQAQAQPAAQARTPTQAPASAQAPARYPANAAAALTPCNSGAGQ